MMFAILLVGFPLHRKYDRPPSLWVLVHFQSVYFLQVETVSAYHVRNNMIVVRYPIGGYDPLAYVHCIYLFCEHTYA